MDAKHPPEDYAGRALQLGSGYTTFRLTGINTDSVDKKISLPDNVLYISVRARVHDILHGDPTAAAPVGAMATFDVTGEGERDILDVAGQGGKDIYFQSSENGGEVTGKIVWA